MPAAAGGGGAAGAGGGAAGSNRGRLVRGRSVARGAGGGGAGAAPGALAAGDAPDEDENMRDDVAPGAVADGDAPGEPHARRRRVHTGARIKRWCVSVQARRGKQAHCYRCFVGFNPGEWRVAGAIQRQVGSQAHTGNKWMHLGCVDGHLPAASSMEGYPQLSEQEREALEDALTARGGPVLPLLDPAQEQAPVAPAQAAVAAAGEGAGAAPCALAEA